MHVRDPPTDTSPPPSAPTTLKNPIRGDHGTGAPDDLNGEVRLRAQRFDLGDERLKRARKAISASHLTCH